MFKIGEFSRLSMVTVKTLRHYDKLGLLKPAEVDPFTGYRYYSANQLPRLNRILALKDLGLSLEQIGQLLEGGLTPDQIRGMLRLKQVEIVQQLQAERARLDRVEWRLMRIEQEESMSGQDVALKNVSAVQVAAVRDIIPAYDQIGQLLGEIFGYLGQAGVGPAGPPVTIYHDPEYREKDVDVEVAVPVVTPVPESERVKNRQLPAVENMACIVHEGGYDSIGATYGQISGWIEANGYQLSGPSRELYLKGPESGEDPSAFITEIQIPVSKG